MNDSLKVAVSALLAAVIAFLVWVSTTYLSSPAPGPSPIPSVLASPSAVPSPSPIISAFVYSQANRDAISYSQTQSLYGSRGEVVPFILTQSVSANGCQTLPQLTNLSVNYFKMMPYVTSAASFAGAVIGPYLDALTPVTQACPGDQIWADINIPATFTPGSYPVLPGQTLTVWNMTIPAHPTLPIYAGLDSYTAMQAQGYPAVSGVNIQGPVTQLYINLYRSHRVEPIEQAVVALSPGNIDTWASSNASFRQLVLNGAIAAPCIFSPAGGLSPSTPIQNAASLQYAESLIQSGDIPPGSWGYVEDEGTDISTINTWLQNYQINAPDLLRMITHVYDTADLPLANPFVTNLNLYSGGTIQWGYVSCSAQGNCVNTTTPAAATGVPMMVIDAPTVNPRAFVWVMNSIGAKAALYYEFVYSIMTAWTNQYQFGGNGDGNLIYPTTQMNPPTASIRLKQLRQGSFDQEYLAWGKTTGLALGLVTSVKVWDQNNSDYEAARIKLGNQINAGM
jgi:hypothetical protein